MQDARASKCDLHVHSKYSDRPSEWFLRRMGTPESFVEPQEVYRHARQKGMDFVTISDHNCIRGALEIAHLPGAFISNEVTTYFPENGCKVHILVTGIGEQQFRMIQELRANIYTLPSFQGGSDLLRSLRSSEPFPFSIRRKDIQGKEPGSPDRCLRRDCPARLQGELDFCGRRAAPAVVGSALPGPAYCLHRYT
jgi:hypothetical protein